MLLAFLDGIEAEAKSFYLFGAVPPVTVPTGINLTEFLVWLMAGSWEKNPRFHRELRLPRHPTHGTRHENMTEGLPLLSCFQQCPARRSFGWFA
jgi:hypothetical protein